MISIHVEKRDRKMTRTSLARAGKIPAVFYGKRNASTPVSVSLREFTKAWQQAGESGVVTLVSPDGDLEALIHEVTFHSVTDAPMHADFYVFEKGQKLRVKVPIEFIGVAPAVKELGGVLVKVVRELEIEAEPKNLPHRIDVDVSPLVDFKSVIAARSISLPAGVTLVTNADEIIASVYEPKEEVVETAPVDLSQIEVEKKGKEKEGEEGAAPAEPSAAAKKEEKKEEKKEGKK